MLASFTPLHLAAQEGDVDIVRLLVENGGNVEDKNDRGQMPIPVAATFGRQSVLKFFIDEASRRKLGIDSKEVFHWRSLAKKRRNRFEGSFSLTKPRDGTSESIRRKFFIDEASRRKVGIDSKEVFYWGSLATKPRNRFKGSFSLTKPRDET